MFLHCVKQRGLALALLLGLDDVRFVNINQVLVFQTLRRVCAKLLLELEWLWSLFVILISMVNLIK